MTTPVNTAPHAGTFSDPVPESQSPEEIQPPTRRRIILTRIGWFFFAVFCLIFFTLVKMPDDRIKAYIDSAVGSVLSMRGISYSAKEGHLSILFGPTYHLKDVTLNLPPPQPSAHMDQISVSPAVLGMIFGRIGASFSIENGTGATAGSMTGSFSNSKTKTSVHFKSKSFEFGKTGLLGALAEISGSGTLDGSTSISGDFSVPNTLSGDISLRIGKMVLDPQTISGFSIPKINISEATIDIAIDKGKATIKTLKIGKPGNPADDIQATISGDVALAKNWDMSNLNLKIKLSLSESLLRSFILLDAIIGVGKQPDGSYSLNLTGPLVAPMPGPLTPSSGTAGQ